jgi:hypothetical protein
VWSKSLDVFGQCLFNHQSVWIRITFNMCHLWILCFAFSLFGCRRSGEPNTIWYAVLLHDLPQLYFESCRITWQCWCWNSKYHVVVWNFILACCLYVSAIMKCWHWRCDCSMVAFQVHILVLAVDLSSRSWAVWDHCSNFLNYFRALCSDTLTLLACMLRIIPICPSTSRPVVLAPLYNSTCHFQMF